MGKYSVNARANLQAKGDCQDAQLRLVVFDLQIFPTKIYSFLHVLPCTRAAQLTAATVQNGTQADTIVKSKCVFQKVSLTANPEPHPNNGNASRLVKSMFPHQKVLSIGKIWITPQQWECKQSCERQASLPEGVVNWQDLNHTPTVGMQAVLWKASCLTRRWGQWERSWTTPQQWERKQPCER